jgi:hypothetical protein
MRVRAAILTAILVSTTSSVAAAATTSSTRVTTPAPTTTTVPTLLSVQQHDQTILQGAVTRLNALSTQLDTTSAVSAGERAGMDPAIADSIVSLQSALTKVALASSLPAIEDLAAPIHAQLAPVVHLVIPQVDLIIAADRGVAITKQLASYESWLSGALANAASAPRGRPVSSAQQAFASYQSQLTAASGVLQGVSSAVFALTVSGYPGNMSVLTAAQSDVQAARSYLSAAHQDLQIIWGVVKP